MDNYNYENYENYEIYDTYGKYDIYDTYGNNFSNDYNECREFINKEFTKYIMDNLNKFYNVINGKMLFKLQKIGSITTLFNKIEKPKKKLIFNLQYQLHNNVIILLLENLILLISNRGLFFDFNNYDYILFDILNNDTIEEVYFIKLKNKIDKKYFSIWLFHKDNMFEYII